MLKAYKLQQTSKERGKSFRNVTFYKLRLQLSKFYSEIHFYFEEALHSKKSQICPLKNKMNLINILKSTSKKKGKTLPDSIFRRFVHFEISFLIFIINSFLFTMRRDHLQITSIYPLNMDTSKYFPKYGYVDFKDGRTS